MQNNLRIKMADHIDTGLRGEDLAADYLASFGWSIVERRWREPHGMRGATDVDIIAVSRDGVYHFVEVKTRTGVGSGRGDFSPESAVTPAKARRMIFAAERYMAIKGFWSEIAVDVIAVCVGQNMEKPEIHYYPDAVR